MLPLALDRALKAVGHNPFWLKLAEMTHHSVYRLLEAAVDYGLAFYRGDEAGVKLNVLARALPREVLRFYDRRLVRGMYPKSGRLDPFDALLLSLSLSQRQIALLQRLSVARNAGVATRAYTTLARHVISTKHVVPLDLSKGLLLLRSAINEEFGCLPRLTSVAQALELRKDPNLKSLRSQLALFHGRLAAGDYDAVPPLRMEVRRAARALNRARRWDGTLRWLTYLSVPAFCLDLLLGNPMVGGALTVLSVTATAATQRQQSKNSWVLFGRGRAP